MTNSKINVTKSVKESSVQKSFNRKFQVKKVEKIFGPKMIFCLNSFSVQKILGLKPCGLDNIFHKKVSKKSFGNKLNFVSKKIIQ